MGDNGTVLELDYDTWTPVESGASWDLVNIWGESVYPLNKYAVAGKNAPVIHYDGSNRNLSTGAAGRDLRSVWGISSNDIIAVGAGGTIIRYNNPPTPSSLNRLLTETRRSPDTGTAAGKIIYNIEYTFDDNSSKNGNIHKVVYDGKHVTTFTYNEMNELTGITHPDNSTETLTYDDNGNLIQTTKNSEITSYEWDCFDRLMKVTMPAKYGAEAGEEISFAYDGDHKLTKIDYPDISIDIAQSGIDIVRKVAHIRFNGQKTSTETDITTHLVHIRGQLLGQYNSAPGSGTPQYYHYDHNNNLALITDQHGNIQEKPLMDSYGNVLPLPDSSGNKEALTLSSNLLTGGAGVFYIQRAKMYNMRRRFYNSFLRRFYSADPIKMGVNYFSYTDNNPLGFMDSSGLAKIQNESFDVFNEVLDNKEGNKDTWIRRLKKANEFVPRILNTKRCLNAFYEYGPGGLSKRDYRILAQWSNISISFKWTDEKFVKSPDYRTKYGTSFEFAFVPADANDYSKIMMSLQMLPNYYAQFLNQVLIHELAHTVGVPGDISYNELISDQYHVCCEIISWECLGLSAKDSFHLKANWPERTRWWIYKLYGYSYIEWMELRDLSLLIPSKVSNEKNRFDLEDRVKFYSQFNEYKTLAKAKKACKCLKKYADSFPKNYNTYVQNFYNRYIKERK